MNKSRAVILFLLAFPVLIFAISVGRAYQLAGEGEVPALMRDLDCDGNVSRTEWLRAGIDLRTRPGKDGCTEVWHAKTGRTIVTHCPSAPACRRAPESPKP